MLGGEYRKPGEREWNPGPGRRGESTHRHPRGLLQNRKCRRVGPGGFRKETSFLNLFSLMEEASYD